MRIVIKSGDSVVKLAQQYGHFCDTVWHHPENDALRIKRKRMNVLMPGDELFIPELRRKTVAAASNRRHVFRRKGVPAIFRLQLFDEAGEPRAHQRYELAIDDAQLTGTSNAEGIVEHSISPQAERGRLVIGPDRYEVHFELGQMDPISEPSGVQKRLRNLGYYHGACEGGYDDETRAALASFQRDCGLPITGDPDESTLDKLELIHDEPDQALPSAR